MRGIYLVTINNHILKETSKSWKKVIDVFNGDYKDKGIIGQIILFDTDKNEYFEYKFNWKTGKFRKQNKDSERLKRLVLYNLRNNKDIIYK